MHILVIDDDQALCRSLEIHLTREGHKVLTTHTGRDGLDAAQGTRFDLAFVDLDLPDTTGIEVLETLKRERPCLLTAMITGVQDAKATISAIRVGAFDYIRKPLDLDAILVTLEKAAKQISGQSAEVSTSTQSDSPDNPYELVGGHPSIIEILKQIALVAESQVPVLILGESGTGKELVARTLHDARNPSAPFVAVNCSAVVSTLLESELFGHVKGSFTGADSDRPGKLEVAGEGSVFFDEIGDMALDLQSKLLRVLQEREFERVGSAKSVPFKAHVIGATNRNLKKMVAEGSFREDLYYRIAVTTIHVPPLRERRSDIELLVRHMLSRLSLELHKDIGGIEEAALKICLDYSWPGNARELNNVLTRAALLARGRVITRDLLATALGDVEQKSIPAGPDKFRTLKEAERDYVYEALLSTGWNIKRTADLLDITRVTLRKKIEDYGLARPIHLTSG